MYFGVEEGSKAHRLYDPDTNKIIVSRDVVFEEAKMWNWNSALDSDNSVEFNVDDEVDSGIFAGEGIDNVEGEQHV